MTPKPSKTKARRHGRSAHAGPGSVRIIAGRWRGRRLPVADAPGLRPSGDRGREILFNWLQGRMEGARCLDLFAGSGALGFEAASRGAASVVMLEKHPGVCRQLEASVALLQADSVQVQCMDALRYLDGDPRPFDLVFVDPPYDAGLYQPVLQSLRQPGWMRPAARVYVEYRHQPGSPDWLDGWNTLRHKRVGDIGMWLLSVD